MRRALVILTALAAAYLLALFVLGFALAGLAADRARDRLAASLDADVTIEGASLNLFTGDVTLRGIHVVRDRLGRVEMRVDTAHARLAPMGAVLFDRDVRTARVKGVRVAVTAIGIYELKDRPRQGSPIHFGSLRIEDAEVVVEAMSFLPDAAATQLRVARAETRDVSLRDGLAWLFHLRELDATVDVPGVGALGVTYAPDTLSLQGGPLGINPLQVTFKMPPRGEHGYEAESVRLLAEELGKGVVRGIIERKLRDLAAERLKGLL